MILGTFESSAFAGIWAQILFLCYSFLVVIILLNVLIAIVSDAYDAVLVTSTELFWHSRLELVVEITTTFEWLLRLDVEGWRKRFMDHFEKWFDVDDRGEGRLQILYGLKGDHPWANGKNKVALGVRILFSPVLLGLAIAIFLIWFLPWLICFTILDKLNDNTYSQTKKEWKDNFTFLYGLDSSKDTSNKKSRLLLVARIIFSPLLITFTIGFILLWWIPYSFLATILGDPSSSSDEVELDLKLDSSSSDWSGRVLDIVRRVNTITSSESAKTNAKIDALTKENASLKKMLSAIATKVGAEVELEDKDKDQQVVDEKNDDPDEPLGAEVDLEDQDTREGGKASGSSGVGIKAQKKAAKPQRLSSGGANGDARDTGDTSTVGQKKTQTHADVAAPKDEERNEGLTRTAAEFAANSNTRRSALIALDSTLRSLSDNDTVLIEHTDRETANGSEYTRLT